jgi:hypothetical protein
MCDYRRGFNWWMNLLITYTHDSELQAITVPLLISTIHKSPQRPLNLIQPAVSSPAVPWKRLLTVEIFQLHALKALPAGHRLATELMQSRAEQKLTAGNQPARSLLASGPGGTRGHIFISWITITFFIFLVGRPVWREDGSDFYICCWPLPAQSFFGPSPLGLAS